MPSSCHVLRHRQIIGLAGGNGGGKGVDAGDAASDDAAAPAARVAARYRCVVCVTGEVAPRDRAMVASLSLARARAIAPSLRDGGPALVSPERRGAMKIERDDGGDVAAREP